MLVVLALAGAAACTSATTIPARPGTEQETKVLSAALTPLLAELRDPALHRPGCPIGVAVLPSRRINAAIARRAEPCAAFSLLVTEGALQRLPVQMLRAIFAHELGHLALHHTPGKNSRAHEVEADRFAVALLKRIESHHPEACVQLVYVLASLAEQGTLGATWLASHPSPERRAEAVLEGCNR